MDPLPAAPEGHVRTSSALRGLWQRAAQSDDALSLLHLTGADPVLPSSFAVGSAAQAGIAAAALAAAELGFLRTGRRQQIAVDMRHAAIECRSERYLRVDGRPVPEFHDAIAGLYRCGDGRWARLHTNFPHHRDGVLALLQCAHDRAAVAHALQAWSAFDLEDRAAAAGLAVTAMRSFAEWDAHPQGRAVAALPPMSIERIGDAPVQPLPEGETPLAGIRVLDLTRVIAGPVCGRTLAGHGADVLLVSGPQLPSIEPLVIDTGRGKLSCHVELRTSEGRETLRRLLSEADVFVQGFRPGALAALGFGAQDAARLRPGLVHVSLSAYGHEGPWAQRRGFDSLVQTASGFNDAEARAAGRDEPLPLPAQILDHASGYLMAFGAMSALRRRAVEGGSWQVRVSLAQTAQWLRSLGRVEHGFDCPDPGFEQVGELLETSDSGFGRLDAIRHAAQLSETPVRWRRPSVPLGSDPAAWPVVQT